MLAAASATLALTAVATVPSSAATGTAHAEAAQATTVQADAAQLAVARAAESAADLEARIETEVVLYPTLVPPPPRCAHDAVGFERDPASVRLTFDDGPGYLTEQILDVLAERCVHATFYVVGTSVERHPETLRRILDEGHALGNHSLSHPNLRGMSRDEVRHELARTQDLIEAATGYRPTAFRPPFGAVNRTVREVAGELGLTVDLWTVDPRDWSSQSTVQSVHDVVVGEAQPGGTVLLHVQHQRTLDALTGIIDALRARGLTVG